MRPVHCVLRVGFAGQIYHAGYDGMRREGEYDHMRWSLRPSEPVHVSSVLTLVTLGDARAFVLSLSDTDQRRRHMCAK